MGRPGESENGAGTDGGEVGNGKRLGEALSAAPVGSLGAAGGARGRRLPPHQALQVRPGGASHALIIQGPRRTGAAGRRADQELEGLSG
jgi:hypothetical protein